MTTTTTIKVEVGQILKETSWIKNIESPFISYTRIDAIVQGSGNDVNICGPGATTQEGTAHYLQIFGEISTEGKVTVEKIVLDEWGGKTVREVLPLDQLPEGYV